jgi:hypothetical protein
MHKHALCGTLFLIACSGGPTSEPLSVTAHTAQQISGSITKDGVTLRVGIVETNGSYVSTFDFGDMILRTTVNTTDGTGRLEGNGIAVTDSHHQAVLALFNALPVVVPPEKSEQSPIETMLLRQVSFVASGKAGDVLPTEEVVNKHSITYLNCDCSWQDLGNGYWQWAGMYDWCTGNGGNGCKGRCGVGCGYDNQPYYNAGTYSRDCGRHDYGWAPWSDAFDDYSWGSWNCW